MQLSLSLTLLHVGEIKNLFDALVLNEETGCYQFQFLQKGKINYFGLPDKLFVLSSGGQDCRFSRMTPNEIYEKAVGAKKLDTFVSFTTVQNLTPSKHLTPKQVNSLLKGLVCLIWRLVSLTLLHATVKVCSVIPNTPLQALLTDFLKTIRKSH